MLGVAGITLHLRSHMISNSFYFDFMKNIVLNRNSNSLDSRQHDCVNAENPFPILRGSTINFNRVHCAMALNISNDHKIPGRIQCMITAVSGACFKLLSPLG